MRICWDWKSIIGKIQRHKVTKLWTCKSQSCNFKKLPICKVAKLQRFNKLTKSQSCNVLTNLQSHKVAI